MIQTRVDPVGSVDPLMTQPINLVLLGGFLYPKGMAPTHHMQDILDGLKDVPDVATRVVVLRQSSRENVLSGTYRGIPYETVMGDLLRAKALLLAPVLRRKARQVVDGALRPGRKNVLWVYGPPTLDNVPIIRHARQRGFKVVFYITEDDDAARCVARSPWHRLANAYIRHASARIGSLADGIMVISSHLEAKFCALTRAALPLHIMPITVNLDRWPDPSCCFGDTITLFYAGSFGFKDGIPVLMDAFDRLAARHGNLRLVLTGKGSPEDMHATLTRIESSAYKKRITYKGYLEAHAYQAALNAAHILCMTRIDHPYAQAGVPFKLGEYLATGKPVVASKVSDVPMWLRHEESAMLVKPGSASDIVRSVDYLLQNPAKAVAMGRCGREVARRSFCHKMQAKALHDFIQSI